MSTRHPIPLILAAVFGFVSVLAGAEFTLMDQGKAACSIVLEKNAGVVEHHAAAELAAFLAKISGGSAPEIGTAPREGTFPIRLRLTDDTRVAEEGFRLHADARGLEIAGRQGIGTLYGVYEILKRYGGIRWLAPGADGEYFKLKPTIVIPEMDTVSNPSFEFRTINWGAASILSPKWDSFDWMVRNNLRIFELHFTYLDKALHGGLAARGAEIQDGGHCFSDLLGGAYLGGTTRAQFTQNLQKMYQEHPEYFPLINGKRVMLEGQKYQPCTSNPEVTRIMSENLIRNLREFCSQSPAGRYRLVNDDGTGWCECEKCRAQDPADEAAGRLVVTRYWSFVNKLAENACKAVPGARINSIAYQNYKAPPKHILPSKSLSTVELSFNRICYRHKLDDPACLANREYYAYYTDWAKLAKQHDYRLVAYAQIDALGAVDMPIEDVYVHDIKLYHKLGIIGLRPQLEPVDGKYSGRYANSDVRECWYGMWQTLYLFTQYAWDIGRDYPSIYEEINALYYGEKAWKAGMRDFRALLRQAFQETPGCYGHGHSSPLGRCLDKPGVHDRLLNHLAAAEKAAADDPDKRALKHVQRERAIFARTWEKFRKDYIANYREVTAYRKSAPIVIDGVLDEADWQNADVTSNFKRTGDGGLAKEQTYVRVTYEPENIYFGIEAMEPETGKIKADIKEHDGPVWTDSTIELFLTHPDLGTSYYHLIFNANGTVFDRFVRPGANPDVAFESGAEVKTKILGDRWVLEIRVPTAPLGEQCFDGQAWKANVLRARQLSGVVTGSGVPLESSTWSMGSPHDVAVFLPLQFGGHRAVSMSRQEVDPRLWKNPSFNKVREENKIPPRCKVANKIVPSEWSLSGENVDLEMVRQSGNADDYFVKLKSGTLVQHYGPWKKEPSPNRFRINFRAKGHGEVEFLVYVYTYAPHNHLRSDSAGKLKLDSDDWKHYQLDYEKQDADVNISGAIRCNAGEVCIDDVFFTAAEKGTK